MGWLVQNDPGLTRKQYSVPIQCFRLPEYMRH
jgi:hypothetical protein